MSYDSATGKFGKVQGNTRFSGELSASLGREREEDKAAFANYRIAQKGAGPLLVKMGMMTQAELNEKLSRDGGADEVMQGYDDLMEKAHNDKTGELMKLVTAANLKMGNNVAQQGLSKDGSRDGSFTGAVSDFFEIVFFSVRV